MPITKNILNKPELKEYRKSLRNHSTPAEKAREKLIIELDGNFHAEYYQIGNDITIEKFLTNQGFIVIRFENKSVFQDPDYVIETIKKQFKADNT